MSDQSVNRDPIFDNFLLRQMEEGMALATSSDLLELAVSPIAPPHFVATFHCKGLVQLEDGSIEEANFFQAGIWFPPDYLRRVDPFDIVRWFGPSNIFHPNISVIAPLVCLGRISPGTGLTDLLMQLYDIITYNKFTPREDDCLNKACCSWVRDHQHRFPVDRRPLKRRPLNLEVSPL